MDAEIDAKVKSSDLECTKTISEAHGALVSTTTMKRRFSMWNIIALGFNISNSWVGIASSLAISIATGGTVTLLYGIIVVSFVMSCTALSLAELGCVYPTAGGQYHFIWFIAPQRFRRVLSYMTGATSVFAWISLTAAINIVTAQILMAMVLRYDTSYIPHAWQIFLVYVAFNVLITVYNILALRKTLWMYNFGALLSVSLCIAATIACPAQSGAKGNSHTIWTSFINSSNGWPNGVAFLTGMSSPQFMLMGLDSVLHMAEECLEPRKVIPKALMATVFVGSATAFGFAIAMVYSVPEMTDALSTATGFPIYYVWEKALHSHVGATLFIAVLLVVSILAMTATVQTASRLTWSMARDNALWQSKHLASVHLSLDVPIWSLVLNGFIVLLIGIVYVCSTTAFNAFIGSAAITSQVSIALPILVLLLRKRGTEFLPSDREFKLPTFVGYFVNSVAVIWSVILLIFLCFPVVLPATGSNMNYCSIVIAVMGFFGVLNWFFYAKKHFHGPQIDISEF